MGLRQDTPRSVREYHRPWHVYLKWSVWCPCQSMLRHATYQADDSANISVGKRPPRGAQDGMRLTVLQSPARATSTEVTVMPGCRLNVRKVDVGQISDSSSLWSSSLIPRRLTSARYIPYSRNRLHASRVRIRHRHSAASMSKVEIASSLTTSRYGYHGSLSTKFANAISPSVT